MDRQLKQRVVGAALLVAFGVIFIPIFLDNGARDLPVPETVNIPPVPPADIAAPLEPLSEEAIQELESRAGEDVELPLPRAEHSGDFEALPATAGEIPAESLAPDVAAPAADPMLGAPPPAVDESAAADAPSAPTPAPSKTPSSDAAPDQASASGWTVQLGSFSQDSNARGLQEKLRAAGYAAQVERQIENGATVFKVRVGRDPERAVAERLRARLEREFNVKGMLIRYP